MSQEKMDRRVRRTRALMQNALVELMNEKPFSEITAKDITEKADLNRATFYLHYNSVFELLDELEDGVVKSFSEELEKLEVMEDGPWEYPLIKNVWDFADENKKLCRCLLLNPRSDRLAEKFIDTMKKKAAETRERGIPGAAPEVQESVFQFIACGSMGLVKQWLWGESAMDKAESIRFSEKLIRPLVAMLIEAERKETM